MSGPMRTESLSNFSPLAKCSSFISSMLTTLELITLIGMFLHARKRKNATLPSAGASDYHVNETGFDPDWHCGGGAPPRYDRRPRWFRRRLLHRTHVTWTE